MAPATTGDSSTQEAQQHYRLFRIVTVIVMALACAVPLALNIVDPDLWGHVRYGQDWLATGVLPRQATHTYAAPAHPWINHENAAELLFALGFAHFPVPVMLTFKCAWGMAILGLMAWTARRHGVSAIGVWAFLLLVAANLQGFFPMRPQLLTFALLSVALVCLDRGFPRWPADKELRLRWLWVLPVVFAAWVNSHGGFAAGLCIVGGVLCGRMVEGALGKQKLAFSRQCLLAAVGLACIGATLINPYGWNLHRWLLGPLGSPPPEITEWEPPRYGTPVFWPLATLLLASVASWLLTRRRRDWAQIAVFALVAWQALEHLRHIALLSLLAGFWLPPHFTSALQRLRPDRSTSLSAALPARWFRWTLVGGALSAVALQSWALGNRLSDFPVYRNAYPVDALQFMVDHRMRGKLVVSFNWAQYALSALAPHVQVGFDGRFDTCYPREVIDMHFDFLLGEYGGHRQRSPSSGPIDPVKVLAYGSPDLVLIDREYRHPIQVMRDQAAQPNPEWTLLYRDSIAELWGRREKYDDPAGRDFFPLEERTTNVRLPLASFQWPALPDYSLWEELERAESAARSPTARSAASMETGPHLLPSETHAESIQSATPL